MSSQGEGVDSVVALVRPAIDLLLLLLLWVCVDMLQLLLLRV